jgi:hypothetical protein
MKITVHNVVVDRDKMTKVSKQVWPWELPILESKFSGGLVKVNGSTFVERDSLPDSVDEFIRLQEMYGLEEGTNIPHVHIAFDRDQRGMALMAKAIKGSVWKEKKARKPRKAKVTKVEAKVEDKAEAKDPLE